MPINDFPPQKAIIPRLKYISACDAMQPFIYCMHQNRLERFFHWTRHLHMQWFVCSNSKRPDFWEHKQRKRRACIFSKKQKQRHPGDTKRQTCYCDLRKPITTQQEKSGFVVKQERWRRWEQREEEEEKGEFKTIHATYYRASVWERVKILTQCILLKNRDALTPHTNHTMV